MILFNTLRFFLSFVPSCLLFFFFLFGFVILVWFVFQFSLFCISVLGHSVLENVSVLSFVVLFPLLCCVLPFGHCINVLAKVAEFVRLFDFYCYESFDINCRYFGKRSL